jgi:putative glycosyltransferase (TIGR04348 family)
MKPQLCIVTPALAEANNGNWQTARRWARMLAGDYRVRLAAQWTGEAGDDLLLALHARRSAASIARWAQDQPEAPLVVALTGTDLYQDIQSDAAAQRSLQLAHRLLVLQELAPRSVPEPLRHKVVVCFQSTTSRQAVPKAARHLRALMVGHLRTVKDPVTYFEAVRRLALRTDLRFDHVGGGLDPVLARQARALATERPHYRWLGDQPHAATRRRIQHAHVLVHPSRLEGGAHVVMEAVCSATPVLASRVDGNVGMLGPGYDGYFEPGDAQGLARQIARLRDDPAMLGHLQAQCATRANLFLPASEQACLRQLLASMSTSISPSP